MSIGSARRETREPGRKRDDRCCGGQLSLPRRRYRRDERPLRRSRRTGRSARAPPARAHTRARQSDRRIAGGARRRRRGAPALGAPRRRKPGRRRDGAHDQCRLDRRRGGDRRRVRIPIGRARERLRAGRGGPQPRGRRDGARAHWTGMSCVPRRAARPRPWHRVRSRGAPADWRALGDPLDRGRPYRFRPRRARRSGALAAPRSRRGPRHSRGGAVGTGAAAPLPRTRAVAVGGGAVPDPGRGLRRRPRRTTRSRPRRCTCSRGSSAALPAISR